MLKALMGSLAAFLAVHFLSAASVSAQAWPNKLIAILTGFPAGSGVDVVARMLRPSLENSPGRRLLKRDRAKLTETAKAAGAKIG